MHKPFVYFGTPYVARDTLAALLEAGWKPSVVITNPDAPRGRGLVMTPSETRALALEKSIPVLTPAQIDGAAIAEIKKFGCEYAIVVAYGKLLPQALIDAFPLGIINVHYSLLPKYRGASPVESALLNGDSETGVAIQKMVLKMDAGDILAMQKVTIGPAETSKELKPRLIEVGAKLLADTLPSFEAGTLTPVPQDESQVTRAKKIDKADGELDLTGDSMANWNKYRAYAEWPGTYFFKDAKRIKIVSAHFENGKFIPLRIVPEGKTEIDYKP